MECSAAKKVDVLANHCCTLMTLHERDEFFKYQRERKDKGLAFKKLFDSTERYACRKGSKRSGQIRDVYHVNPLLFNELWDVVLPYVLKSSLISHDNNYQNAQEDVSEIKYGVLYVLRYFGPTPNDYPLSSYIKLIVNNKLTTSARRRGFKKNIDHVDWYCSTCDKEKTKDVVYFHHKNDFCYCDVCGSVTHITHTHKKSNVGPGEYLYWHNFENLNSFTSKNQNSYDKSLCDALEAASETSEIELLCVGLPYKLKAVVMLLLSGYTLTYVARNFGTTTSKLRRALKKSSHVAELIAP